MWHTCDKLDKYERELKLKEEVFIHLIREKKHNKMRYIRSIY